MTRIAISERSDDSCDDESYDNFTRIPWDSREPACDLQLTLYVTEAKSAGTLQYAWSVQGFKRILQNKKLSPYIWSILAVPACSKKVSGRTLKSSFG
jgi:hypothetical protein